MGHVAVTFLNKEYIIPTDVLTYIDLLTFAESIQKDLMNAFVNKVKNNLRLGNTGLIDDADLMPDIERQVGKFIAKLCDNDIFTRTISDYLSNNKGYELFSNVNTAALNKIKSLLMHRLDSFQEGYENALQRADAHVTGMGFSILSSSFVNHAIYAAMEASTISKQEKEATAQYQREINALSSRLESDYDREKTQYINNEYIPNMEAAFTIFAFDLLDKYVADLIANGKFDRDTLRFVDIRRSNDLLKNLTLSNNKHAILENAFTACPYNIAVYMQAMKYDLLDYDSFQTAKVFKQSDAILSFLKSNWGEVSFPTKFNINYHYINIWASFIDKQPAELLYWQTNQYASGIAAAYSRISNMIADHSMCCKIIEQLGEKAVLSSGSICRDRAIEYVDTIVTKNIWEQLTERCGHDELVERIRNYFPSAEAFQNKTDLDVYLIEQLTIKLEEARRSVADQIIARRELAEQQRIEQERARAEIKAKKSAKIKKTIKHILLTVGGLVACFVLFIIGGIIYLDATDKPIDGDFAQHYKDTLHGLVYYVPENWEFDVEDSSEDLKYYTRYNNWDEFLVVMAVNYIGDKDIVSVDEVISDYTEDYTDALVTTQVIGEQNFNIVSYIRKDDNNCCRVYIIEQDFSVFQVYFRFAEGNSNNELCDEIVDAIAFEEYVNPKESTYSEAIDLMLHLRYSLHH